MNDQLTQFYVVALHQHGVVVVHPVRAKSEGQALNDVGNPFVAVLFVHEYEERAKMHAYDAQQAIEVYQVVCKATAGKPETSGNVKIEYDVKGRP